MTIYMKFMQIFELHKTTRGASKPVQPLIKTGSYGII